MNTKYVMVASALFMAVPGLAATFMPDKILELAGSTVTEWNLLFIQIAGALYIGFALLNWAAKSVIIGGIYAKPLSLGNFMHFFIGSMALIKTAMSDAQLQYVWLLTIPYCVFALLFGIISFTSPKVKEQ